MPQCECDTCWHWDYDEEYDEYYCTMDLDEDEFYRYVATPRSHCPYYRQGDDYTLARKQ
jgi:hypothetical protein